MTKKKETDPAGKKRKEKNIKLEKIQSKDLIGKVKKPKGLPRFQNCKILLRFDDEEPSGDCSRSFDSAPTPTTRTSRRAAVNGVNHKSNSYFINRWKNIDTESVLAGYAPEAPFMATVAGAHWLTSEKSNDRRVLHMELELPKGAQSIQYQPGDCVGIYCPNRPSAVAKLVKRLKLDVNRRFSIFRVGAPHQSSSPTRDELKHSESTPNLTALDGDLSTSSFQLTDTAQLSSDTPHFPPSPWNSTAGLQHILSPCTIQDALTYGCDLNGPIRKPLLRMLAEYCSDQVEQNQMYHLLTKEGRSEYESTIERPKVGLLEILERFPSCYPPLDHILDLLPALKPRYYSVTSSPTMYPTQLHIAFTLVHYESKRKVHQLGLCTSWLTRVCQITGCIPHEKEIEDDWKHEPILDYGKEQEPKSKKKSKGK